MFVKLIILFAIFALAMARPQLYSGYGYNNYPASYPGYAGYSGYSSPVAYSSYGGYSSYPYSYSLGYY